jgi:hypothetical protein
MAVAEGSSVKVTVPVGDGLADGFRFTGLRVKVGGRKGTGVNVGLGSGVNVSVGRDVAVAVAEEAGSGVCVDSAVSVSGTVEEAFTAAGAATGVQAVPVK